MAHSDLHDCLELYDDSLNLVERNHRRGAGIIEPVPGHAAVWSQLTPDGAYTI